MVFVKRGKMRQFIDLYIFKFIQSIVKKAEMNGQPY